MEGWLDDRESESFSWLSRKMRKCGPGNCKQTTSPHDSSLQIIKFVSYFDAFTVLHLSCSGLVTNTHETLII